MGAALGENSYGKSRVRLVRIVRRADRHDLVELTADIALTGDFTTAHTDGDNSLVLPTDTMKNTVYALAKDDAFESAEAFALRLARHFVASHAPASGASVRIAETLWQRLGVGGAPHPHAFRKDPGELRTCVVGVSDRGERVTSGIEGLVLLKTTDSAFHGYPKDRYTTLKETDDRILATSVTASWAYTRAGATYPAARESIRTAIVETFAGHKSLSVQHTLYAMGEAALDACPDIDAIRLSLPNKHCLLVDLAPFGMENPNEVFVPVDEPYGLIEATVRRA